MFIVAWRYVADDAFSVYICKLVFTVQWQTSWHTRLMTNCSILQAHWTQLITPCGIGHRHQSLVHFLEDKSLRFRKLICRPTFILCMNKKYTAIYRLGYGLHTLSPYCSTWIDWAFLPSIERLFCGWCFMAMYLDNCTLEISQSQTF